MKSALRGLGWVIAILIASYFVWFVFRTFRIQDVSSLGTLRVIAAILLGACLYSLIMPISGTAWAALLKRQGESWPPVRLATIMAVTQLAKYIPGNVAQHIGRAAMSVRHGMSLRALTTTVIQESVLAIAASVAIGLIFLLLSPFGIGQIPAVYRGIILYATLIVSLSLLLLARGPMRWPEILASRPWIARVRSTIGSAPGAKTTLIVFAAYCLNYMVIGVGIWLVSQALGTHGSYALLTAAFCLSWLLGFVMPGAPAGLGVREGAMALLLAGAIPQHQILALVLAVRLVTVVGDGICFGCGLLALRHLNRENC